MITYNNKLLASLAKQDGDNEVCGNSTVLSPTKVVSSLESVDNDYKGSNCNVMIEWESGEVTSETLKVIAADDPVTCAIDAKDHGIHDKPGWKQFKSIDKGIYPNGQPS